jgi:hypothetical protein
MNAPTMIEPQGTLATLEYAFYVIGTGPGGITVHGGRFTDLPDRPLSLPVLRARLATTEVSPRTRAAIWAHLVTQARTRGPRQSTWTVVCAGMARPELSRIVASLTRPAMTDTSLHSLDRRGVGRAELIADLEAAALGGFLSELRRTDLDNLTDALLRRRLLAAGYRAARTVRDTTTPRPIRPRPPSRSRRRPPAASRPTGRPSRRGQR